jgi:hypothetical protein
MEVMSESDRSETTGEGSGRTRVVGDSRDSEALCGRRGMYPSRERFRLPACTGAPGQPGRRVTRESRAAYCVLLLVATLGGTAEMAAEAGVFRTPGIVTVLVSEPFFNPTIGQRESIGVTLSEAGLLSVSVLDRDGYLVRHLVSGRAAAVETLWYQWDGRDDQGLIVPDEAYSLKVDLTGSVARHSYFPGRVTPHPVRVQYSGYDRLTGVLSYRLDAPARVHVQAGVALTDPYTDERDGPVLRTIADREPRPGGAVVESWDGFDETGTVYVADLSGFAIAVAATSLPENVIITSGNLSRTFAESVASRTGEPLLALSRTTDHRHHKGLSTLDDISPSLHLDVVEGEFSKDAKVWELHGGRLSGRVSLSGPSAIRFSRQPAELLIFVDGRRVRTLPEPRDGGTFEIDLGTRPPGAHIVALNWVSGYGPAAATCVRVRLRAAVTRVRPGAAAAAEGGR